MPPLSKLQNSCQPDRDRKWLQQSHFPCASSPSNPWKGESGCTQHSVSDPSIGAGRTQGYSKAEAAQNPQGARIAPSHRETLAIQVIANLPGPEFLHKGWKAHWPFFWPCRGCASLECAATLPSPKPAGFAMGRYQIPPGSARGSSQLGAADPDFQKPPPQASRPTVLWGWHNLRHSLSIWLVSNDVDGKTVSSMLRHSNLPKTRGITRMPLIPRNLQHKASFLIQCCLASQRVESNSETKTERNLPRMGREMLYRIEKYGRHEETRTPDLYRVKVAL